MTESVKYQKDTVDSVFNKILETLASNTQISRQFVIAPTGSGKTVMAAAIIERLGQRSTSDTLKKKVRVVFITHSKTMALDFSEKFKQMNVSVSTIDDIENRVYTPTTVLLSNPEKFSAAAKEGKDFLSKWLGKKEDEYIVLVMDEGDITHDGKRNTAIKDLIAPDFEICFSATFDSKKDEKRAEKNNREKSEVLHKVKIQEVIDSGMIVKSHEYLVNVNNATFDSIMNLAYDKQIELTALVQQLPMDQEFIPKILIQVQSSEIQDTLNQLSTFLKVKHDVKLTPEMYCIINQDVDEQSLKDKNKILFYLGDQLIGRGWDSPQTYIVVSFKKSNDMSVGVQLLGRVSRMPFQKHFDLSVDALNKGYVYVNGDHSIVSAVESYITEEAQNSTDRQSVPVKMVKVSELRKDIQVPEILTYVKKELNPAPESVIMGIYQYLKNILIKLSKDTDVVEHTISKKEIDSKTGAITHINTQNVEIEVRAALNHISSALIAKGFPSDTVGDALSEFIQDNDCKKDWKHFHKLISSDIEEDSSRIPLDLLNQIEFESKVFKFTDKMVESSLNSEWKRSLYQYEEMGESESSFADWIDSFCAKHDLYWTKNVENRQVRLSAGYYPDFIIFNKDKYIFYEYKGAHLKGNANTLMKIEFGETHDPKIYMVASKGSDFVVINSKEQEILIKDLESEMLKKLGV